MKCSYCGAEADQTRDYCRICGTKLPQEKQAVTKNTFIEFEQDIPQETAEQPAASNVDYPKTRAALEEIFGPEQDWAPPPQESAFPPEDETWDFPVTPFADLMGEKEAADDGLPPVYSTAPLRNVDFMPEKAAADDDPPPVYSAAPLRKAGLMTEKVAADTDPLPVYSTAPLRKAGLMTEKAAADTDPLPVYSAAPLREDVFPPAPTPETSEEAEMPSRESMLKLPTGRSLVKMILLGLVTAGIYPTVIWSRMVTELNIAASRNDGKRTMPYLGMLMLEPITLGVFSFVWMHRFCNRVGGQLMFRKCDDRFGAKDFWLWCVLGSLILVGPFIFTHKLLKSMNWINNHYNTCGW